MCRVFQEHVHLAVAVQSPRRLFVHASVVGYGEGAIVLIGDEGPRDALMVGLLDLARATYYSNRYAVLDRGGRVHAYPTPLARGSSVGEDHDATRCPTGTMVHRTRRKPLPVKVIAVVDRIRRPSTSAIELSPAQAALALLRHTVASRPRPRFALEMLRRPVSSAVALDLRGHPSEEQAARLVEQLNRWEGKTFVHPHAREDNLLVERIGDELLVYDRSRHRAHRLSRASALMWRHCDGQRTVAELARMIDAELEIHVDERIVWLMLKALDRAGLLRERLLPPPEVAAVSRRRALSMGLPGAASLLRDGRGVNSITAPMPLPPCAS
jgi:hypothetical protein